MAIHQQANLTVTLNNEQAKRELEELQVEMKRLIDLRDKSRKAGDLKAYQGFDNQLKKATRQARSYERQLFDVNKALRDLSGASLNDLLQAKRVLTRQTAELGRQTAQYARKAQQLKLVNDRISRVLCGPQTRLGLP